VSAGPLDAGELALLARVAAVLLPADEHTADDSGAPDAATPIPTALATALAASPGLVPGVREALATLAARTGDLDTAVADLVGTDAVGAQELALAVAATHYADPAIRAAVGYPGPAAIPLPDLPDPADAELEPLMARLAARGPSYRDA
jgi:hypothetical protein